MMTFTEGNTNRDVPCFWMGEWGLWDGGMVAWWDGREQKVGSAEKNCAYGA